MTTAKPKPSEMPGWPRGLSRELAAAYVGVSVNTFMEQVEKGLWPKPSRIKDGRPMAADKKEQRAGRLIWDRLALDARFDELSGLAAPKTAGGNIFSQRVREWEEGRQ